MKIEPISLLDKLRLQVEAQVQTQLDQHLGLIDKLDEDIGRVIATATKGFQGAKRILNEHEEAFRNLNEFCTNILQIQEKQRLQIAELTARIKELESRD